MKLKKVLTHEDDEEVDIADEAPVEEPADEEAHVEEITEDDVGGSRNI